MPDPKPTLDYVRPKAREPLPCWGWVLLIVAVLAVIAGLKFAYHAIPNPN